MTKSKKEFIHKSGLNQTINIGDKVIISYYYGHGFAKGRVIGFTKCYVKCLTSDGWSWNKKPSGLIVVNNKLGEF